MSDEKIELLKAAIRDIPDFPKEGILFKDITPLLNSPEAFETALDCWVERWKDAGITKVAGIESRGFIFGVPLALRLGAGFVPVRKPGKLPAAVDRVEYELEYGTDAIEMHQDAMGPEDRVLVVDDVIATGGTLAAALELCQRRGAQLMGAALLIELTFLQGRAKLGDVPIQALVQY